jgi:hypothetical protein
MTRSDCHRFRPWRALVAMQVLLGFFVSAANAALPYSTDFESPSFLPGNLSGQDGWISDGGGTSAQIQSAIVKSDAQAVGISTAPRNSTAWWFVDQSYNVPIATTPLIRVEWDMYVASGAVQSSWGVDVYNIDSGLAGILRVAVMVVDTGGLIRYWDGTANLGGGGYVPTAILVPRNQWHHYRMDLNYATKLADYYYDGGLVAGSVPMSISSTNILSDADIFNIGGSNPVDAAYYDNFRVFNVMPCPLSGDMNNDGLRDGRDVQQFLGCVIAGGVSCECADMNNDGAITPTDVNAFVTALLGP